MPDLTIEHAWVCKSNMFWTVKCPSSDGKKSYDVTWRRTDKPELHDYAMYGWHCSCPAYQYGKGKYCKHIQHVIKLNERCGWNQGLDTTAKPRHYDEGQSDIIKCPKCDGQVESIAVGV